MSFQTLQIAPRAQTPGVVQITMNRPDVFNAFDETMIGELEQAFVQLGQDETVRAIVLAGAGRHFSAGADLQWMRRASEATYEWNLEDAKRFARMLSVIDTCAKPTIARVQGAALGGGTGLACACDMAVATEKASFAVSEAKFGILPAVIGPYLVNAVGTRQARRLALTASRINGQEACDIGIVQKVVPDEAAMDAAIDAWVADLLVCGPKAQAEIKSLMAQLEVGPVTEAVRDLTARTISRVRGSDEAKAGFAAFLNKQPAPWAPPQA